MITSLAAGGWLRHLGPAVAFGIAAMSRSCPSLDSCRQIGVGVLLLSEPVTTISLVLNSLDKGAQTRNLSEASPFFCHFSHSFKACFQLPEVMAS